jgi:hypothetical protein
MPWKSQAYLEGGNGTCPVILINNETEKLVLSGPNVLMVPTRRNTGPSRLRIMNSRVSMYTKIGIDKMMNPRTFITGRLFYQFFGEARKLSGSKGTGRRCRGAGVPVLFMLYE